MTVHPVTGPPVRLYCFPHAGATSQVYRGWQPLGEPKLRIRGVDAPGAAPAAGSARPSATTDSYGPWPKR